MGIFRNRVIKAFLAIQIIVLSGCLKTSDNGGTAPPAEKRELVTLEQGWNNDERLDFYNTSQGSQLIPYSWFLALEQAGSEALFRADDNIRRLGYIPQQPIAGRNSDGLPIGFVKDDNIEPFLLSKISASRLAPEAGALQSEYQEWLGLTCAACHISEIELDKHVLRIDGGPPLSDFQSLIEDLSKALQATVDDDDRLTRFAKKVLAQGGYSEGEKQRLRQELIPFIAWLDNYIEINYGGLATAYGYGRLDAFGAILNRVTASFTGIAGNATPANAPVSYPFLWNTSQLSWVQWNGSANNHIGRNVGEVSGVFADTVVKTSDPAEMFRSSAKIMNLDRLENLMSQLDSPKWQVPLPAIDQDKAVKGKALFAELCVACHGIRDEGGQFPMTDPNPLGKQFIKVNMIKLNHIGTDPLMAMNFVNPALNVDPGVLRSFLPDKYQDAARVPRAEMLSAVVRNVIGKQVMAFSPPLDQQQLLELSGYHLPIDKGGPAPPNLVAYKARPLNGVWATAPFLHNGSVSSLYQLLLPDTEREKSFDVGGKDFDVKNVGFLSSGAGNRFRFNTLDSAGKPIPGNGNHGHSGNLYTATRAQDGQWRNFNDEERYQLIEYMKTL
ncbi:MAG: cytochrome c [Gammaproteobacteria bacterium]|nr:cytochrome c [Gammaproteobacteria bacterium]